MPMAVDPILELRLEIRRAEKKLVFDGRPYPEGLQPFPENTISGQAFFPGGDGLWREHPLNPPPSSFPFGGIMVLGNDFGLADNQDLKSPGFCQCLKLGFEDPPTWTIKDTIRQAGIPGDQCFFTNAYLGLRSRPPIQGPSPGLADSRFAHLCRLFLEFQLNMMRPRLIVLLGHEPRKLVAPPKRSGLHPIAEILHPWCRSSMTFEELDAIQASTGLPGSIRMVYWNTPKGERIRFVFVIVAHPSFAWSFHAQYPRHYDGFYGANAEVKILHTAWILSQEYG